ncbi:hypothetical protein ACFSGI_22730 [Paenibacillus nicotianae]|uniref:Methyl-accepting chemotaxis protein n=1 Tax=Paenibacillus nicotianae TaxID=1526551 RepID=A0ABW4V0N9_9BACL
MTLTLLASTANDVDIEIQNLGQSIESASSSISISLADLAGSIHTTNILLGVLVVIAILNLILHFWKINKR